jgi:hypothetical protein
MTATSLPDVAINNAAEAAQPHLPTQLPANLVEAPQTLAEISSFPGQGIENASEHAAPLALFAQANASFPPAASVPEHPITNPPPENLGQVIAASHG